SGKAACFSFRCNPRPARPAFALGPASHGGLVRPWADRLPPHAGTRPPLAALPPRSLASRGQEARASCCTLRARTFAAAAPLRRRFLPPSREGCFAFPPAKGCPPPPGDLLVGGLVGRVARGLGSTSAGSLPAVPGG